MKDDYPLYIKWRYIVSYMLDTCAKLPKSVRFNLADRLTNISLDVLEPLYEKRFIDDSYATRKGKGAHSAISKAQNFILQHYQKGVQYLGAYIKPGRINIANRTKR